MKIVFLNVWGDNARDELIPYLEEQALDTDVFCFQEASEKFKQRSAKALAGYYEISDYKYINELDFFPQSIFIKNGIKLVSSGALAADDMNVGLVVYAELEVNNTHLFICNVHGMARPGEKLDTPDRLRFSTNLIDFFKDKNTPIVIGGDFNLEPTTKSITTFEANNYRDLIKDFGIETTRNHFAWDRYPDSKLYHSDYVFLNNKIHLKDFIVENNEISDHLPMIVEIVV